MSRYISPMDGYFPLARAVLCLDCDTVAYIGPCCPNCASEHRMSLETWLYSLKEDKT